MKKHSNRKKLILGVTGSFGTGKTTVARILRRLGAEIIDADRIAHEMIRQGKPAYKSIIRIFGGDILKKNKDIDRLALSRAVFGNRHLLKKLEKCLHPRIIAEIRKNIRRSRAGVIVLDAPLLLEAGLGGSADKLIVVVSSRSNQIKRLGRKTRLSPEEIKNRINTQIPLGKKAAFADFIIDNNGTLNKTKEQVTQILAGLIGKAAMPLRARRK